MNYVGTARPIHDAKGKATGYTKYAGDLSLPNMAYLCMLHSKIPHGYVKAVHAEKALALPGVYGVYPPTASITATVQASIRRT